MRFNIFFCKSKNSWKLILMYVDNSLFGKTSINLRIFIYLDQKLWALRRNKMEICIIGKSRKLIATKL